MSSRLLTKAAIVVTTMSGTASGSGLTVKSAFGSLGSGSSSGRC
jgi:hypothetical protein